MDGLKVWLKEHRENLVFGVIIVAALLLIGVVGHYLIGSAFDRFISRTGGGIWWLIKGIGLVVWVIIKIILGLATILIALFIASVAGFFVRLGADVLDVAMGRGSVSGFLKFLFTFIIGLGVAVLYVFLLAWATWIPPFAAMYGFISDVPMLRESPLSQWGWYVWGVIAYIIGWVAYSSTRSSSSY